MPRATPFEMIFGSLAPERFPAIRDSLAAAGADPRNRDAFLLDREVVTVLREVVPEDGVGEAIDQHVALLHTAYLFWHDGQRTVRLPVEVARGLLATDGADGGMPADGTTSYVQYPERLVWARLAENQPHEPLDGLFVAAPEPGTLRVLGVFGMHQDRPGISIAEVAGPRPAGLVRPDRSPLFSPALDGGAAAGLHSMTGAEELLELGARSLQAAGPA